eukprot:gene20853-22899_t
MTWTKGHDVLLCREVLVVQPFQFKHGTHDRGQSWEKIAANLNLVERPLFTVDQRAVRDRFTKLEKDYRKKKNEEERASGIAPDEPDELDQALEDIIEMSEWQKEQLVRGNTKKKNEVEKEKKTAEAVRKRAMERMGETRERENEERSAKKRKSGTDAVEYLKEKREEDGKMKEGDLELRKREFELKNQLEQQQAILEEVQQQNKLLLSLYQKSLEKI